MKMKILFCLFMLSMILGVGYNSQGRAAQGDLKKGKTLYFIYCVECHGPHGKGNGSWPFSPPPVDLTLPIIQQKSDYALWKSLHDGVPNSAMVSWKWVLTDREEAHLLAYVQSLGR